MLISLSASFAIITLRPYGNDYDNSLSVLSYVQISMVMMCGLVLKSQDLVENESSFDKENLGYVLIAVNVLLLLSAVALGIGEFKAKGHENYTSNNVVALAKRRLDSHQSRSESEVGRDRGSTFFDTMKSFIFGEKNSINMLEAEIELGYIYSGGKGGVESFKGVNPVLVKKVGWGINSNHPAPQPPRKLTEGEIERLGPPPTPTTFTSSFVKDNEEEEGGIKG